MAFGTKNSVYYSKGFCRRCVSTCITQMQHAACSMQHKQAHMRTPTAPPHPLPLLFFSTVLILISRFLCHVEKNKSGRVSREQRGWYVSVLGFYFRSPLTHTHGCLVAPSSCFKKKSKQNFHAKSRSSLGRLAFWLSRSLNDRTSDMVTKK